MILKIPHFHKVKVEHEQESLLWGILFVKSWVTIVIIAINRIVKKHLLNFNMMALFVICLCILISMNFFEMSYTEIFLVRVLYSELITKIRPLKGALTVCRSWSWESVLLCPSALTISFSWDFIWALILWILQSFIRVRVVLLDIIKIDKIFFHNRMNLMRTDNECVWQ